MTAIYLEKIAYDRLIDQLCNAFNTGRLICPVTEKLDDTRVKEALGVFGDIWPETIKADVERQDHT